MTAKELFSKPDHNPINERTRTKATTCPICREVFYGYERIDNARISDEPYQQPMNSQDHLGYIAPRQTCGSPFCYIAEERYAYRLSPFFNESLRDSQVRNPELERPKNIKTIGDKKYDLF